MDDIDIKIKIEAAKAEATLAKLNATLNITAEKEKQASLQTDILQKRLDRMDEAAQRSSKGFSILNIAFASFIGNITSRAVTTSINSIINGIGGLISAGQDFEAGLIQVAKTTGLGESAAKQFGDEITRIALKIPVATDKLLEIATVAGQLGIKGVENLTAFTETLAKLQLTTDISAEEGSQAVARILGLTNELQENGSDNIKKFGAVLTELGNNFAATESQILNVANEVAKGTAGFDIASEDVLGLAVAFKASGSEAEISGSVIQKVFKEIGEATVEGGDKLALFAKGANMTTEEFTKLFQQDPTTAFLKLAEGLDKTSESGTELNRKLVELGFNDARVLKTLTPLIARYDTLSTAISTARKEAQEKNALDQEAAKSAQSLTADIQQLKNSFDALGKVLFTVIGPILRSIVQGMTDFIKVLLEEKNQQLIQTLAVGFTVASAGLVVLAAKAIIATGALAGLATAAAAAWVAITGPIGLTIIGLAAVSAAVYDIVTTFQDLNAEADKAQGRKNADDLAEGYKNAGTEAQTFLSHLTAVTGGLEEVSIPLDRQTKELNDYAGQLKNAGVAFGEYAAAGAKAAAIVTAFEDDKTRDLKKFFKDEEIAKLNSNFAIIQSEKEKEAFLDFVAQEGQRRRTESFKASIGLDKLSLEAQKDFQKQMQELRKAEDDFLKEQAEQRQKLVDDQLKSKQDVAIAEEAIRLFTQTEEQIFLDERLVQLQDYFTREEEARVQAALNAEQDEVKKQTLLNKAVQEGLNKRLQQEQRAAQQQRQIDALKAQSRIAIATTTSELITTILGNASKEAFIISKAVAFAENIVNTQSAMASIDAAWAWNPPVAATLMANAKIQGALRGATILASAIKGFENGGVVGGSSFTGDNVMARVNSGEMILNRQQQSELFKMAQGAGGGNRSQEIVVHTTVELDGEAVGHSVSRQVANGLVLGEVQ